MYIELYEDMISGIVDSHLAKKAMLYYMSQYMYSIDNKEYWKGKYNTLAKQTGKATII